jgi:SAM-dependent methyltransferase
MAAKAGAKVTGLDLNAGMLAVARGVPSEGTPINWVEGSALDLPLPSESFDVVLCQLGLQFFPDQGRALGEMFRVLRSTGRAAVSVYSPIERTPGANAFVLALDEVLGAGASQIKRDEHSFADGAHLEILFKDAGFAAVTVQQVVQAVAFPSVLDYVKFQLLATPMTVLLRERSESERQELITLVASRTTALLTPAMLADGRFTFPQEAYVGIAVRSPSSFVSGA